MTQEELETKYIEAQKGAQAYVEAANNFWATDREAMEMMGVARRTYVTATEGKALYQLD